MCNEAFSRAITLQSSEPFFKNCCGLMFYTFLFFKVHKTMQSGGVCGYVDDTIVLLARRFEADPENFSEAWHQVSEALYRQISRPATSEERQYFLHVDPALFTASVCRLRCQYVLWKAKKQRSDQKGNGFDVTKDSIGDVVAGLYSDAKLALPSTLVDDNDDSEDDDVAVPVHTFKMKTQEEAEKDAALARAEDDLLTKVAQLQHEHFMRHRRWVDVPENMLTTPSETTLKAIANTRAEEEAASSSTTSIQGKRLADFTVKDVATLLKSLDLEAFTANFKRTDGALLQQLSKADIRHRTDPDFEAADVLWARIQQEATPSNGRGNGAAIMAAIGALSNPAASGVRASSSQLTSFERGISGAAPVIKDNKAVRDDRAEAHADPFSAVKRSLNPSRPQRPSATRYDDDEEEAEEILKAYRQDLGDDLPNSITPKTAPTAASSPNKVVDTSSSKKASPIASPPAPRGGGGSGSAARPETSASNDRRAGRWNIVEYSDDDADDE